eukprot:11574137-Alexandrium_andersonii.AAC.1
MRRRCHYRKQQAMIARSQLRELERQVKAKAIKTKAGAYARISVDGGLRMALRAIWANNAACNVSATSMEDVSATSVIAWQLKGSA